MVFVTFADWVEKTHGEAMLDALMSHTELASGGAYTAVGQYPYEEVIELMGALSARTGQSLPDLCREFGKTLFNVLVSKHAKMMPPNQTLADFLQGLQGHIHEEVVKLYPNAKPPVVNCELCNSETITLHYTSSRPFADLAEGLLMGAIAHFGQPAHIKRRDDPDSGGKQAIFELELQAC